MLPSMGFCTNLKDAAKDESGSRRNRTFIPSGVRILLFFLSYLLEIISSHFTS